MNTQTRHFPRTPAHVEAGLLSTLPAVRPAAPKALSKSEVADLARLELEITEGFQRAGKTFAQIGEYLEEIRSRKLYRGQFEDWTSYCRAKWNKSTAWALMQRRAAAVMKNLADAPMGNGQLLMADGKAGRGGDRNSCFDSTGGVVGPGADEDDLKVRAKPVLPTNESQVRALAILSEEKQREVWDRAKAVAGERKQPTAKQVAEAVGKSKWPQAGAPGLYSNRD